MALRNVLENVALVSRLHALQLAAAPMNRTIGLMTTDAAVRMRERLGWPTAALAPLSGSLGNRMNF
jgi:hypothetical protein